MADLHGVLGWPSLPAQPCLRLSISVITHYDPKGLGEERAYLLTLTHPSPSSKEVRPGTNAEAIEEFPLWLGLLSTRP